MKSHQKKSGCDSGLGELPKIWRFPFSIYTMGEASDFKFGTQLEFEKTHHKITCRRKSGHGPGLGELTKIWKFPFKAVDFKIGTSPVFAKADHKITSRRKVRVALG